MSATSPISYFRLGVAMICAFFISLAWLIFPYLIEGQNLMRTAGDTARLSKGAQVSAYYTRHLVNHPRLELTATFATPDFFQFVDRTDIVNNLRPDQNLVFFVGENIHEGVLAGELPDVVLTIGELSLQPSRSIGPRIAEHHRVTVYTIPLRLPDGTELDLSSVDDIRLTVSNHFLGSPEKLAFVGEWSAPFELPDALASQSDFTPIAVLALGAGLLSTVLTPCLLQLVVIFGSIIGSFSTIPGGRDADTATMYPVVRRKIMQVALAFVVGFTTLYILAGALIGSAGHAAQLVFAEYSRTVAIVAGVVVIAMGLWVGVRAHTPRTCPIVDRSGLARLNKRDAAHTMLVSMGYALGCTACFGGAIVATLIIYVGAIGSASVGAAIMATFSAGIAIPFLISAWYLSRMDNVIRFLNHHARGIGYASMVTIVLFGLILVTDNFHVVSDAIYPFLGLG